MPIKGTRLAVPKPRNLLDSMRSLGYSTGSALADIIDNSISKGAKVVSINFEWAGSDSYISILDDGVGMSDSGLEEALNFGVSNPSTSRDSSDLGRFGMGLKTASLSQCRRLTVFSKQRDEAHPVCLRWDLDELQKSDLDEWLIFEGPSQDSVFQTDPLINHQSGTLVVWEKLDRIIDVKTYNVDHFLNLIDVVENHLAMVFHRFLASDTSRLKILINEHEIKPWDPFLMDEPSKPHISPEVPIGEGDRRMVFQSHVLPHRKMISEDVHRRLGGPEGWVSQQGFYVYRNLRLIQAGGWLGLSSGKRWRNEAAYQLVRIRLDIASSCDTEWEIDIKKSVARAPKYLRPRLVRLSEEPREIARAVLLGRERKSGTRRDESNYSIWESTPVRGSGSRYRIARNHPLVKMALEESGNTEVISSMIELIENLVPVEKIWASVKEQSQHHPDDEEDFQVDRLESLASTMVDQLRKTGEMSFKEIRDLLLRSEPFCDYPNLVVRVCDRLERIA